MSYAILPGDRVRYAKTYTAFWWETRPRIAYRLARMRGTVVAVDAHPKGDLCDVRWQGMRGLRTVEARHLRRVTE